MRASELVVALDRIEFRRGEKTILHDITWEVHRSEHWALLGANGSGKTSLLRVLTGYAWPSSGAVTVLGRRYGECDLREHRKRIGWVSAALEHRVPHGDSALEIVLSGFDASLGLYRPFHDQERARAHATLEILGGAGFAGQAFETLSQGEQKRTLIARALVHAPALLVLDEPCAGLDPVSRRDFLDDLSALARSDDAPAMIFVTHHVEEIRPWVTHVHALCGGRTAAQGTVRETLRSDVMTEVLGRQCSITRRNCEYRLQIDDHAKGSDIHGTY